MIFNTSEIGIPISANLQTKSASYAPSESQETDTVTPDSGYDGLSQVNVTVNAISSTYIGSEVTKKAAATYYPGTTDQSIAASQYLNGAQTIKAVTVSGLSADKVLSGTTVKIGDAVDDDRIMSVAGTVVVQNYYTGSSAPSSSLGSDGDLYLQV